MGGGDSFVGGGGFAERFWLREIITGENIVSRSKVQMMLDAVINKLFA